MVAVHLLSNIAPQVTVCSRTRKHSTQRNVGGVSITNETVYVKSVEVQHGNELHQPCCLPMEP